MVENHHVSRALRLAQLNALRAVLKRFQPLNTDDDIFVRHLRSFIDDAVRAAQHADFSCDSNNARQAALVQLPPVFDDALAARRAACASRPPDDAAQGHRSSRF